MNAPVLHYVYDPLCGWCYAAEPLFHAAGEAGVPIVLHGGGLWDPAVHATDAKRRMMRETDDRIGQLTGQPFGVAYLDGLLVDPASVWWSRPTIAAVLAAQAVRPGSGAAMVAAIQHAHYVEGRRVVEDAVLIVAATRDRTGRRRRSARRWSSAPVDRHIRDTRALMRRYGLQGYPSFLFERENGPGAHAARGLLRPSRRLLGSDTRRRGRAAARHRLIRQQITIPHRGLAEASFIRAVRESGRTPR